MAWLRREIGPRIKGSAVSIREDAHGPAAVPRERRGGIHVDGVNVGPLLTVDLDADEMLVEVGGYPGVLE